MRNATEETRQVQTDTHDLHSIEGSGRHATFISRRPSWADTTTTGPESITHSWTAPTVAKVICPDGTQFPAPVELYREDEMLAYPDGVALAAGVWRIFLLDAAIEDTVNARRLSAAILECCDRIEQAAAANEDEQ